MKKSVLAAVAVSALVAGLFTSCNEKKANDASNNGATTVKIGVCGSANDQWKAVQYELDKENAGIKLELVEFSAYNLPNEALNSGDIQLNSFQHVAYFNKDSGDNKYDLSIIGDTLIAPLTLYSKKFASIDEIKAAAGENGTNEVKENALKFAIPSDGTNLSRGIKLLETAGLIEVDPAAGYTPELKDITKLVYNVEVLPQAANTLPQTLDDYAGATINGTYATSSGLVPSKDGLLIEKQDESGNNPFVNILVARTADKDNEVYAKILKTFQTQTVAEYLLGKYKEAYFPAFEYAEFTEEEAEKLIAEVDATIKW